MKYNDDDRKFTHSNFKKASKRNIFRKTRCVAGLRPALCSPTGMEKSKVVKSANLKILRCILVLENLNIIR